MCSRLKQIRASSGTFRPIILNHIDRYLILSASKPYGVNDPITFVIRSRIKGMSNVDNGQYYLLENFSQYIYIELSKTILISIKVIICNFMAKCSLLNLILGCISRLIIQVLFVHWIRGFLSCFCFIYTLLN